MRESPLGGRRAPSLETVPPAAASIGAHCSAAGVSAMPYTMDVATQVHLNEPSPVECRDVEVYFLVIP